MNAERRVLIAGAGPVGCVAALYLGRRGIPVTLFEARETLLEDLRASTFHPPTLDMLDELGVVEALIAQGIVVPRWQYRARNEGVIAEWDLGLLAGDTGHPYRLQAEQYKLTHIVMERLLTMPEVEVRFQARATGATQDGAGVTLALATRDGVESARGEYLIAADGAGSEIRKSQGIGYPGLTFPEMWLVASTPFDFSRHFDDLTPIAYFADPEEWFVFVKVPELWRVMVPARPGESEAAILEEARIEACLQGICAKDGAYDIRHRTAYVVHQRVAESYRAGRVFLAGDAAHINNPLGGMGMNGGIHDAVNLCEKLVRVWRGEAGDEELDRYHRQRRPIAVEHVQKATIENKARLEEADPEKRRARYDGLRRRADDPVEARAFLLQSSMIRTLERAASLG